jgi:hypothetical protein
LEKKHMANSGVLLALLLSASSVSARQAPAVSQCPAPFAFNGHACVLGADATLTSTVEIIAPGTTIDCQNHRLSPSAPGTLKGRSTPEVALAFTNASALTITNCHIEGFDWGIYGNKSQEPANASSEQLTQSRNHIVGNTIRARFYAIELEMVDNTEVSSNELTATSPDAIVVGGVFSSDVTFAGNHISVAAVCDQTDPSWAVIPTEPGVPCSDPKLPFSRQSNACFDPTLYGFLALGLFSGMTGGVGNLLTMGTINGHLYQVHYPADRTGHDNILEGNHIDSTVDGSPWSSSTRCAAAKPGVYTASLYMGEGDNLVARDNLVEGGQWGMRIKGDSCMGCDPATLAPTTTIPGTCSRAPDRFCLVDADCNLAGIDAKNLGKCQGTSTALMNHASHNNLADGNTVVGATQIGLVIDQPNLNTIARDNVVQGGPGSACIALMGPGTLATATVTGNRTSGCETALFLSQPDEDGGFATSFSAKVSGNSFIVAPDGYGVITSRDYNFATDLSGNYWGRSSAPCFDPSLVQMVNEVGAQDPFFLFPLTSQTSQSILVGTNLEVTDSQPICR